jgi:hypothetical protein
MAEPTCTVCASLRSAEIDEALRTGVTAAAVARKFGLKQTTVARHRRNHLRLVHHLREDTGPVTIPDPLPLADVLKLPAVHDLLVKVGQTVDRLEQVAREAEIDGNILLRVASLRELRSSLVDAAKLFTTLGTPPAPPPEQVDRAALAELLAAVGADSKDGVLAKLLP